MISISLGRCYMYDIALSRFLLSPFKKAFKVALAELYAKETSTPAQQKDTFKRFIQTYGTHFLLRTKMGAEYAHITRYRRRAREALDTSSLNSCNYVNGAKMFGIQVDASRSGCNARAQKTLSNIASESIEVKILTKGGRPIDIKEWATQTFTPIPLSFELSPIINLFQEKYIDSKGVQNDNNEIIVSSKIREWFVPLYFDYCNSMDVNYTEPTGCGIDDLCPIDTICKPEDEEHSCTGMYLCIQDHLSIIIHNHTMKQQPQIFIALKLQRQHDIPVAENHALI